MQIGCARSFRAADTIIQHFPPGNTEELQDCVDFTAGGRLLGRKTVKMAADRRYMASVSQNGVTQRKGWTTANASADYCESVADKPI